MTQPPYGYGPVLPGGQPVPPRPGFGSPYGQPGYGPALGQPGYGQRPGYPPGYGQPGYGPPPGYGQPPGYPAPGYVQRSPMPPTPYGPPGRPPRKRKSGGGWLALLLIIVFVVAGGLVRGAISQGRVSNTSSGPGPSMTYTPDSNGGVSETGTNPLLTDPNTTLIPARCSYSPWSTQVETARKFFETAAACLESAWKPVLAQKNLPFQSPTLNVSATTDGITTPCTGSTSNFAAFYCPANKTIYMPLSQLQTDLFKDNWIVYLSVFAHEYGHHVQAMAGILRKANSDRVDAGVRSDRGLELSRRIELQANCFDGMYLGSSSNGGSLTTSQITLARRDAHGRGDQRGDMRDHGTAENGGTWFEIGVDKDRAAQCNTFTASASAVS
ncbi:neutral zinc metallopeptidase [Nocardia sp. R16R-3T]